MPGMPRRRPELRRAEVSTAPLTVPILRSQPAVRTPEVRNVAPSLRRNWSRAVVNQAYEQEWMGAPRPVRSQAAARARAGEHFAAAAVLTTEPVEFVESIPDAAAPSVADPFDDVPDQGVEFSVQPPHRRHWERVRGAFARLFRGE